MSNKYNDTSEILQTIKRIQQEQFSEIPMDLLEKIVNIEFENQQDRVKSQNDIKRIVTKYLEDNSQLQAGDSYD